MEEILDFQRATPFTGYIIHLSDGRSLEVEHPEFLARSPLGRSIVVYGPLGSLDGTLEATTAGSLADLLGGTGNRVSVSIGFLDFAFMGEFNNINVQDDTLTMHLWGNESLAGGGTSENWGLDWRTVGIVPEPSGIVLALAAFGMGRGIVRRRVKV